MMAGWLLLALNGEPVRSRSFFEEFDLAPTATRESWSDLLNSVRTYPGYQLLFSWLRDFSNRALAAVPFLMTACILLGCDLKTRVAVPLASWTRVPERAFPLALALVLFAALRDTGETLAEALPDLVIFLTEPPPQGLRREPGRGSRYPPTQGRSTDPEKRRTSP